MAEEQRLKGQDTQLRITSAGVLLRTITAVSSMTLTVKSDILSKGYLGEGSERKDEIYKGVGFDLEFDPESNEGIILLGVIRDRASKRTNAANFKIGVACVLNFPNGQRPRVTIGDLKFSNPSLTIAGRDSYVGEKLTGEAEDFKLSLV